MSDRRNRGGWRRALRRELTWLLAAKAAVLALLWVLCFSPAHRAPVDGETIGRQLAVSSAHAHAVGPGRPCLKEQTCD